MKARPAARAAAAATAVIAVVYIVCAIVLNVLVSTHLAEQTSDRLASRLAAAVHDPAMLDQPVARPGGPGGSEGTDIDADGAPVFLWSLDTRGPVLAHSPGAPPLPANLLAAHPPRDGLAITADLGGLGPFQLRMARDGGGWLIAGQALAGDAHTQRLLLYGEVIAGPFLLLAMFGGSLAVGLTALAPVEQSRRRQLEFTADASHELRTPLSVIRAEADVALSSPREAAEYRDALTRIQSESRRLRQLVDDMLWLARFDSRPPPPGDEPVDLVTLAQACADRFRAVGPAITAETGAEPALISAPPEWIDRLAGVLMDNACRYAGADGQVRIGVRPRAAGSASPWKTAGPASPRPNGPGCSTASTAPPSTARARAWGWPSGIRSSARPAGSGSSAAPRWAARG